VQFCQLPHYNGLIDRSVSVSYTHKVGQFNGTYAAAIAGIARSTKWDRMKAQGRDTAPDWRAVSEAAAGDDFPVQKIMDALLAKKHLLRSLPAIAKKHAVPEVVIERAMGRHLEVASAVAELRHTL
jgi:hypothetical protein